MSYRFYPLVICQYIVLSQGTPGTGQDMSEPFYQSSDTKCKNSVLSPRTLNGSNKTQYIVLSPGTPKRANMTERRTSIMLEHCPESRDTQCRK